MGSSAKWASAARPFQVQKPEKELYTNLERRGVLSRLAEGGWFVEGLRALGFAGGDGSRDCQKIRFLVNTPPIAFTVDYHD
jgi:hypothetical protein